MPLCTVLLMVVWTMTGVLAACGHQRSHVLQGNPPPHPRSPQCGSDLIRPAFKAQLTAALLQACLFNLELQTRGPQTVRGYEGPEPRGWLRAPTVIGAQMTGAATSITNITSRPHPPFKILAMAPGTKDLLKYPHSLNYVLCSHNVLSTCGHDQGL